MRTWQGRNYTYEKVQSKKDVATKSLEIFAVTSSSKQHYSSSMNNISSPAKTKNAYRGQPVSSMDIMGNTWCRITFGLIGFSGGPRPKEAVRARVSIESNAIRAAKMANEFFFSFCESYFEHLSKIEGCASSLKKYDLIHINSKR